jgi:hypothetical protein
MKRQYCLFVYASKAAKSAGEMEYTVDADTIEEAGEIVDAELADGMYCVSIFQRTGTAAPMAFLENHVRPQVAA